MGGGPHEERKVLRNRHLASAILIGLVLAVVTFPTPAKADITGFVSRQGTQLTVDGQPYRFTGLNIYNANSNGWCWYPFDAASLDSSLSAISSQGGVIQAWFFQQLATTNGARDWTAFDRTLSAARSHGFRVIATLIDQWGDCGASTSGFGYKTESWYTTGYTQPDPVGLVSYRDWAAEMASRYAADPTILAWQLVNEAEVKPTSGAACSPNAAQILKSFATDVSGLIKSVDPNHLISMGTIGGGQCGAQGAEYQDVHDIPTIDLCEYHDYTPNQAMPGDVYNGLQVRINQCNALDKPIFVGESGIRPVDVGGTLSARARAFQAKFETQFAAGVVGELIWAWDKDGSLINNYDIGPGDAALDVLTGTKPFSSIQNFAISHDGKRIAISGTRDGAPGLYEANRDGTGTVLLVADGYAIDPQFSPDDTQLVYGGALDRHNHGIFMIVSSGGTPRSLTDPAIDEAQPRFSPDGTKIVAIGADPVTNTYTELHLIDVSSLTDTIIATHPNGFVNPNFSPDGSTIIFVQAGGPGGSWEIWAMPASGGSATMVTHFTGGRSAFQPEASLAPINRGKIVFLEAYQAIDTIDPDGSNFAQAVVTTGRGFSAPHWTPSGHLSYLLNSDLNGGYTQSLHMPMQPLQPITSPVAAPGDGSASVSWLPPAYDGGAPVTSYSVIAQPGTASVSVPSSMTTATISGLTNGVTYTFTVTASNTEGTSDPSLVSNPATPQAGAMPPATVQQAVSGGSTATTDPGTGPTPSLPVTTSVTMPPSSQAGIVNISQSSVTEPAPTGFSLVGQQVQISAPSGTAASPLSLTFSLDASATAGESAGSLQIYRTEGTGTPTPVADCTGAVGVASPDPCVSARATLSGGDIQLTVLTSAASIWNLALDKTPPSITFATPIDGATYKLRQVVNASYSCADQGSGITSCSAPVASGAAIDTGSVGTKTFAVTARDKAGNSSVVTHTYKVIFDFTGFFSPISNPPVLNSVKAGASVTESFSLAGNQGLSIIPPPYPKLQTISCTTLVASSPPTSLSGTLRYGSAAYPTRYFETWPSLKSWAGTCAQVTIRLTDGTGHVAYFKFTK